MAKPHARKNSGITFLSVGIAFMAVAASGQTAFLGVGVTFVALGIALLAKARKDDRP